jgi:integrating conjugative element protein (TIGR03757 family)
MVGNSHYVRFVSSSLIFLTLINSGAVQADKGALGCPRIIEVFTTTDVPITGETTVYRQPENLDLEIQIYQLDAIQQIESELSRDLASDPEQAESTVMERIQLLNADARAEIQNAATGLAKAMQYGIDRLPAVVFDGQAVVYGVTDLNAALGHYTVWQAGNRP